MGRKAKSFRTLSETVCTLRGLMEAVPQTVDEVPRRLDLALRFKGFGGSDA
jgi:hypothetical protein